MAARGDTFYGVWSDLRYWTDPDENYYDLWDQGDVFLGRVRLPLPDFDYDRDFDSGDFAIFLQCFGGSNNPPPPTCPFGVDADLNGDADVDTADTAIFINTYYPQSGPGEPWCTVPGGGDGMGGESGEAADDNEPTGEELYEWLEAYCLDQGIPFT
jgi:hypothetical protein